MTDLWGTTVIGERVIYFHLPVVCSFCQVLSINSACLSGGCFSHQVPVDSLQSTSAREDCCCMGMETIYSGLCPK